MSVHLDCLRHPKRITESRAQQGPPHVHYVWPTGGRRYSNKAPTSGPW